MNTTPRLKRGLDLVLAGAFAFMLALPTFYPLIGLGRHKAIDEYRTFAEFHGFNNDAAKDFEKYYDDHFGGREALIASRLRIERTLFPELAGGIISGREGWLYSRGQNMLNQFLGSSRLTLRQLKYRQAELEEHRDQLAARGIKYLFVIAPNKESIYPEYLAEWLRKAAATTETDQFVEYMRLHSTVEILDLRPVLQNARDPAPLFYKTDTHWNLMGAFVACEAMISKLAGQIPQLTPGSSTNFVIQRMRGTGGDVARFAGLLDRADDSVYTFQAKASLPAQKYFGPTNQIDPARFGMLPVLEYASITTTNRARSVRAIVFGDSYTFQLAPFLGGHFGEVEILRGNFDLKEVDRIKPAVVIDERVERWLHAYFYHG